MSGVHPHEELLRREYEARARGDIDGLDDLFADDITWHVPGKSAIAGIYKGKDEVLAYVRKRQELAGGTFVITVHDVLANDEHGVVLASGRAQRNGTSWEWNGHALYRFRDGKIAECTLLPEDQYLFDEIWSRAKERIWAIA